MTDENNCLQVGDRIRLAAGSGVPDGVLREACEGRLLRVQRTEGDEPGYILVSGTRYGDQWVSASDFEFVSRREPTASETIQHARDVLAKWRDGSTIGPWSREEMPETGENRVVRQFEFFGDQIEPVAPGGVQREDASLIAGTAGNPDLLDAIDGMLDLVSDTGPVPATTRWYANALANAILAADKRMNA